MAEDRIKVKVTPEIFRKTWTLQFNIAHQQRKRRVVLGAVFMAIVIAAYFIFYRPIAAFNFIFFTGVAAVITLRELIRSGSYLWDRMHHFGWIKENIEEETAKEIHFSLTEEGFSLYYETYDIHYRWSMFEGYFEAAGFLWLLDKKGEMIYVLCEEEVPSQWDRFKELVKMNVEEVEPGAMKP